MSYPPLINKDDELADRESSSGGTGDLYSNDEDHRNWKYLDYGERKGCSFRLTMS